MEQKDTITAALIRAKMNFKPVIRDRTNPAYKSKYATLDSMIAATQDALGAEGLVVTNTMEVDGENKLLKVGARLHWIGGESLTSEILMPFPIPNGRMDPAQALGTILTYGRRYAYGALLGLATEDDDDAASLPATPKAPEKPRTALSAEIKAAFEGGFIDAAQRDALMREGLDIKKLAEAANAEPNMAPVKAKLDAYIAKAKAARENPELY